MKTALITGITGQDGAYLARFLLDRGYTVWGTLRKIDQEPTARVAQPPGAPALRALGIAEKINYVTVDYLEVDSLARAIALCEPDEIYNLAAQSSVARSFDAPTATGEITALGVARLLHAQRAVRPQARFYQASSSEMFGLARETPQTEATPFYPRSPYGAAKVYAHWMTVNYREAYGVHASCGILFNHESPLRPETFVTRKITAAVARIKHGLQDKLHLGNLDVQRDWGFAGDYVEAMWLMLQQEQPDDYIIATGEAHSLQEFVELAFRCAALDYREWVEIDPALFRPAEVNAVAGCNRKAREKLGWRPRLMFESLVAFMMDADLKRIAGEENHIRYTSEASPKGRHQNNG